MYRYRENNGTTRRSLLAMKHLPKIGTPIQVRAYIFSSKRKENTCSVNHVAVLVKGDKGSARFSGFCWGYPGEGPRGLRQLFNTIGVPQAEIERVLAIDWEGWSKVGPVWQIDLVQQKQAA